MLEKPAFIQGLFGYRGRGLSTPVAFSPAAAYTVPFDKRAQMIYLRAGNPSGELIYLVLMRRGVPMRYFPVGAKGSVHVPLAVVEDLSPETPINVLVAAPEGIDSQIVLDIGFLEIK
jgi:hypothetical protein